MRLIECRNCGSPYCDGCNIYTLSKMLHKGELNCLMGDSHSIARTPESLRPKGAWIMRGGKLYCSHCGERAGVTRDMDDFWYTKGTDFCPSCGADMRGDDDE